MASVDIARLRRSCDPGQLPFETTAELPELDEVVGQPRAIEAIRFGIGIAHDGYNLYAMGRIGTGRHTIVRRYLDGLAAGKPSPEDWCYVHNFQEAHRPRALAFPPGRAAAFRDDMRHLVEDLRGAIPAAFESDQYRARRQEIEDELGARQEKALADIRERATPRGVAVVRTPVGLTLAPLRNGEVLDPDSLTGLPEDERQRISDALHELQQEVEKVLRQAPQWRRETLRALKELNRAVARAAVDVLLDELRKGVADLPSVKEYLDAVEADLVENAEKLRQPHDGEGDRESLEAFLRRYRVNVLDDFRRPAGAPVVYEDNPTLANLIGRVEHLSQLGTLVTDFTLIKPGALHRANGGYLILDAVKLLTQPFAWEALKRILRAREIRIESAAQMLGLLGTVSLEPEPIPLAVKVVLVGDSVLYDLLHRHDPEFGNLFKVAADFQPDMERTEETTLLYAHLIGTLARRTGLRPFDREAVARTVEQASRMAGDAARLTCQVRDVVGLLEEADHLGGEAQREVVTAADVDRAIEARERRVGRVRERLQEEVQRGTFRIETSGERAGQVNGLSVLQVGGVAFGHPNRVTARVRMGDGGVVDIERQVQLGGPIHSKGVLILSGFLAGRYLPHLPLTLTASLVFEQSYGGVEGDSASCAELCALLSALAGAPIRQSLAMTGSVDQLGQVQAVGGVNEKIEGFFDVCARRGLTGSQGVVIPASNVEHLMLRRDVVAAVEAGWFAVHAVETVDEALELLTGVKAGERDALGSYPLASLNERVERRLREFAESARSFRTPAGAEASPTARSVLLAT